MSRLCGNSYDFASVASISVNLKCYKTAEGYEDTLHSFINPRPEGYGSRFVVRSFVHSFVLFTALQRAALTSSRQLRYEQAKHVDGLQFDSWILLKCFRSRVMAGSP